MAKTQRGMPVKKLESDVVKAGQDKPLDIPMTGDIGRIIRTDHQIDVVDGPSLGDYAAELAFNEEVVEIMVHETTDKNAAMLVDVYCNGVPQRFIRGVPQKVKRKFVEVLARAKQTRIKTEIEMRNNEPVNRIVRTTGLRYPFRIENDRNPKGADWLKRILQQA